MRVYELLEGLFEKAVKEKEVYYLLEWNIVKFRWLVEAHQTTGHGSIFGQILEVNGEQVIDEGEKIYLQEVPEGSQAKELLLRSINNFGLIGEDPIPVSAQFAIGHLRNRELKQRLGGRDDF